MTVPAIEASSRLNRNMTSVTSLRYEASRPMDKFACKFFRYIADYYAANNPHVRLDDYVKHMKVFRCTTRFWNEDLWTIYALADTPINGHKVTHEEWARKTGNRINVFCITPALRTDRDSSGRPIYLPPEDRHLALHGLRSETVRKLISYDALIFLHPSNWEPLLPCERKDDRLAKALEPYHVCARQCVRIGQMITENMPGQYLGSLSNDSNALALALLTSYLANATKFEEFTSRYLLCRGQVDEIGD